MISGKFFDQLVESTIKLARALETDNVSTQLDLVFRSISGLFDNLKELSNQKFSSVPIRIDHANNLENQVKIAKNILSLSGTIISLSKQLSKSQITAQRYKNLLELRDKLKKSVEILREGYQKFHLNQTFYKLGQKCKNL